MTTAITSLIRLKNKKPAKSLIEQAKVLKTLLLASRNALQNCVDTEVIGASATKAQNHADKLLGELKILKRLSSPDLKSSDVT